MLVLIGCAVASPLVVRWTYQDWNALMVVIASAPAIPVIAVDVFTIWQARERSSDTSFAARHLLSATYLMSLWVAASCVLGYFVLVLGVIVLPFATAFLARAWVQRNDRTTSTVVLGVTALPFVAWFAGRGDEYPSEALISGGAIVVIIVTLGMLRRGGRHNTDLADV